MATAEEYNEQLAELLTEGTGTTVSVGSLTPSANSNRLSWGEVKKRLDEGLSLNEGENLPNIPEGISASQFYQYAGIPSGGSVFSLNPFSSFEDTVAQSSIANAINSTEDVNERDSLIDSITDVPIVSSESTSLDEDNVDPPSPLAYPGDFMDFIGAVVTGGKNIIGLQEKIESGEIASFNDFSGYDSKAIEQLYTSGMMTDAQLDMYQQGVHLVSSNGEPVSYKDGKPVSLENYWKLDEQRSKESLFGMGQYIDKAGKFMDSQIRKAFNIRHTSSDIEERGGYAPGYTDRGTFIDEFGNESLFGSEQDFKDLVKNDPEKAWKVAQQRGTRGFLGLDRDLYKDANEAWGQYIDQAKAFSWDPSYYDRTLSPSDFLLTPQEVEKYRTAVEEAPREYTGGGYYDTVMQDADSMMDDFASGVGTEDDEGLWMASGGRVGMQEGGEAPPMPQQGAEADMANLGMINAPAAEPQQGGQQSVEDDIPREADEGDYILPYETVLLVGLKDLNRYAREAIDLAMKNNIDLTGTDLDPTDDVPIKVSNYEYHIPKVLVAFFGGGKKYLDKIREEGLALRKRLEEEKQPSAQEQQPQVPMQEAPPQMEPQAAPPPEMAQAAPAPQPPMMQRGGFVLSPDEKKQPTTEAMLEADTTQAQESSYNQMQALERTRKQAQQPPMVDPTGKIVQQGFAAPQGYQDGDIVEDPDLMIAVAAKTEPPMPDWANRALDPKTPVMMNEETGEPQTLGLITDKINDMFHVYPTIRMVGKDLKRYDADEALSITMKKKDSIKFKTEEEANSWSDRLVSQVSELRNLQNGQPDMPPTVEEVSPPMPQEELPPMPEEEMQGFAQQQQPMIA